MENIEYLLHILLVILGLIFVFGINYMHGAKIKIFKALEYFHQNKDFSYGSFNDFSFGLFYSLYFLVPLPPARKHKAFYENKVVVRLKDEYKRIRKIFIVYTSIFALYIVLYFNFIQDI